MTLFSNARLMVLGLSVFALSACTNFYCDHCKSPSDHRKEIIAYQKLPRIINAPIRADAEIDYISTDLIIKEDGVMLIADKYNAVNPKIQGFVYYQGAFVNPMPITTPKGERYLLDFRYESGQTWGGIYLLTHDGKATDPRFAPRKIGSFQQVATPSH